MAGPAQPKNKTKIVNRSIAPRLTADEVQKRIEKKYGPGLLLKGSALRDRKYARASTGSLSFDLMLGGGYPLNKWNEIIGKESSGKTSTIYKVCAQQMRDNPEWECLWVASEPFEAEWAVAAGMDVDRVTIAETGIMEEAYEIVLDYADHRLVDGIIIDSFPALSPADEDSGDMEMSLPALGARINGKFLRKANSATRRSLTDPDRDCLLMVVNQWRDKIGVLYGDPRTTPGGNAKNYWMATRTEYKREDWIVDPVDKRRVGITIAAHTVKNKTAPAERVGAVDFYFDRSGGFDPGDYDEAQDILRAGLVTQVIDTAAGGSKGKKYTFRESVWYGEGNMLAAIREDLDLRAWLRYEALRSTGADVPPPTPPKTTTVRPRKTLKKVA
jgi:recombination protein RecA